MKGNGYSQYVKNASRLADVIAAIQVMAVYKFYKLTFAGWSDRISGSEAEADHWRAVFSEHPEFFRLDAAREKASLVWRRQHRKAFDVDTGAEVPKVDFEEMPSERKARVSRMPLDGNEISTLLQTAMNLQHKPWRHNRSPDGGCRWWLASRVSFLVLC